MQVSDYRGDLVYSVDCTGDACVGDEVCFDRATFTGSFRNPKFAGYERVTARIVKESYGSGKGQHTFTLEMEDGSITRIKGRNLYGNGLYRKPWKDEEGRRTILEEKHERGGASRAYQQAIRDNFSGGV